MTAPQPNADELAEMVRESLWRSNGIQQNDYIGWITRAKTEATRQKRLDQMLDELPRDGV